MNRLGISVIHDCKSEWLKTILILFTHHSALWRDELRDSSVHLTDDCLQGCTEVVSLLGFPRYPVPLQGAFLIRVVEQ